MLVRHRFVGPQASCGLAAVLLLLPLTASARRVPPPDHPLVQWRLGPAPTPAAVPVATPTPTVPPDLPPNLPEPGTDSLDVALPVPAPAAGADSLDNTPVEIVRCRQVLVSDPERAALLGRMLQRGVPLAEATRKLAITDHVEIVREYAVDDLAPTLRAHLASMADSAWSPPRDWRGRTLFVQLLAREQRPRSTIPRLGEGLGEAERQRLARLQRLQVRDSRGTQQNLDPGMTPASVSQQAQPEYPQAATGSGEVILVVQVGRLAEVMDITVEYASDPIFETPAIEAARKSRYRAAVRPPGIAEPGTVRLTYRFRAPTSAQPDQDPQEQDPQDQESQDPNPRD